MTARPAGGRTRREALRLGAAGAAAALLAACARDGAAPAAAPSAEPTPAPTATPEAASAPATTATPSPAPEATPTPTPVPEAGRERAALMAGTEWETPLVAAHSGAAGPVLLVLGGVHGNEPGGWLAADGVAEWTPRRGSLVVVPRANVVAIGLLERTTEALGDLNRLYPGDPAAGQPMARMAAQIVAAARRYGAGLVLDLHESWGFFAERGERRGTAFIGQTITSGPGGGGAPWASLIAERFNARVEPERDRLLARDWMRWPAVPTGGEVAAGIPEQAAPLAARWRPGGGGSSLSLGLHVEGAAPVLVEMGQERQPVERRVELHRLVVRSAMELLGMA